MNSNTIKAALLAALFVPATMQGQSSIAEQPASLRISQGASIIASGDVKIVLNDAGLVNNGSFASGESTVVFTGNAVKQPLSVSGSSRTAFHHLTINRPFEQLQLSNDIAVRGTLQFSAGNLELNNYTLDLGTTGIILGENSNARITGERGGRVVAIASLNAPSKTNPGNIGVEVSATANLGQTVITRGHVRQVNERGQQGINRYYDIQPANRNVAFSARFFYLQPEVGALNENEFVVWSGNAFKGWVASGSENADAAGNWIEASNLSQVNTFTLGLAEKNTATTKQIQGAGLSIHSAQAFPNPARDRFTVAIYSDVTRAGTISLTDNHGRTLQRKQIQYSPGLNTIQWNVSSLAAGTYYVVFEGVSLRVEVAR